MRSDLIEAYAGRLEDEPAMRKRYITHLENRASIGALTTSSYEEWLKTAVAPMIEADSPAERLAHYLAWNGIIGYTLSIYAIATGEV